MEQEIVVSVVCNAYNHEKYIGQALESFVTQEASFAFEVLVHDDASTDRTAEIIRQYAEKYPDIVKPYFQTENQYSKHVPITRLYQYARARGKYIAWCEGDDYWIDPKKLQKQVDALELHPEVDMCAHRTVTVYEGKQGKIFPAKEKNTIFTAEEVINGGGAFVGTNSLMCRRTMLDSENDYTRVFNLDYILQISGSLRGGMLFLADCMSAYRAMADGSWSVRTVGDMRKREEHLRRLDAAMEEIDRGTAHKYSRTIHRVMQRAWLKLFAKQGNIKKVLSSSYRDALRAQPLKLRLAVVAMAFFHAIIRK